MFSDPGTNYEGVGIDDIHIFEKAPVSYRQPGESHDPARERIGMDRL